MSSLYCVEMCSEAPSGLSREEEHNQFDLCSMDLGGELVGVGAMFFTRL